MKFAKAFLLLLNLFSLFCVILYGIFQFDSVWANMAGAGLLCTLLVDCAYAARTKKQIGAGYLLAAIPFSFSFGSLASAAQSHGALSPLPYVLTCGMLLFAACILIIKKERVFPHTDLFNKAYEFLRKCLVVVIPIVLIILTVVSTDVAKYGERKNEWFLDFYASNLAFLTLVLCALEWRAVFTDHSGPSRPNRVNGIPIMLVSVVLCGISFSLASLPMRTMHETIEQAQAQYASAFSEDAQAPPLQGGKQLPFNLLEYMLGRRISGVAVERDVPYYHGKVLPESDEAYSLYYDVYYPSSKGGNRSVLIRLHGAGGDKAYSEGVDRYFASIGYVVYSIQYGMPGEKQLAPYRWIEREDLPYYYRFIRSFIEYAKEQDTHEADWDSVFLSGNSFGGGLTLQAGLMMTSGAEEFRDLGITLRGILPSSGGVSFVDWRGNLYDYYNRVTAGSPPCLLYTGDHDSTAPNPNAGAEMQQIYMEAGNNRFMQLKARYAGHGGDTMFSGNNCQIWIYYAERFLNQYRKNI